MLGEFVNPARLKRSTTSLLVEVKRGCWGEKGEKELGRGKKSYNWC
jgi:hypothetical protein